MSAPSKAELEAQHELYSYASQIEHTEKLQKLTFKMGVHCWNRCVTKDVSSLFSSKERTCVENCADNYLQALSMASKRLISMGTSAVSTPSAGATAAASGGGSSSSASSD